MTQENKLVSLATRIANEFKSVRQQISGLIRDDLVSTTTTISSSFFITNFESLLQISINLSNQARAAGVAKESHIVNGLGEVDTFSNWKPTPGMEETTDCPPGTLNAWKLPNANTSKARSYQEDNVLTAGGSYIFELYVKADAPGSTISIDLADGNGVTVEYAKTSQLTGDTPSEGYLVENLAVPTEWKMFRVIVQLPPEGSSIKMKDFHFNTGTVKTIQYVAGAKLRPNVIGEQVSEATTEAPGTVRFAQPGEVTDEAVSANPKVVLTPLQTFALISRQVLYQVSEIMDEIINPALAGKSDLNHKHSGADITSGTVPSARMAQATASARGAVELATTTEANAGTDTVRAVTPAGLAAYYANHASQGPKGEDGSVWWHGPEAEPLPFMPWKIGDFYLSTTTGDVWRNS